MIAGFMVSALMLSGDARAGEHRLGASLGGTASVGLKTRVPAAGPDAAVWWSVTGERHGLQVELRDYSLFASGELNHLPGLSLGWAARWGEHAYTVLGAGAYLNEVVVALPIVSAEAGVELGEERLRLRCGGQALWVPPGFAAGGGLRLSAVWRL